MFLINTYSTYNYLYLTAYVHGAYTKRHISHSLRWTVLLAC